MAECKFRNKPRHLRVESLEARLNLSGDGIGDCDEATFGIVESESSQATQAVNCFAVDLYQHFNAQDGNLILSPLSISTALAMTAAGAAGETESEMANVLRFGSEPGIDESFKALLDELDREGENAAELDVANAIWPRVDFQVHDEYLEDIAANFHGYAQRLDFSDPNSNDVINDWVEQETQGKIQDIIPDDDLDGKTAMVLANAIYFKSDWGVEFQAPRQSTFVQESGNRVNAPMMSFYAENVIPYKIIGGHHVISIPYEDGHTSMVVLLPGTADYYNPHDFSDRPFPEDVSIDDLTPQTIAEVNRWLNSSPRVRDAVNASLPKFNTTIASDLNQVLQGMGMPTAFSPTADFSRMTPEVEPVFIEQVRHKAFIDVNEHGTEAAGATTVEQGGLCFAAGTPVQTPAGAKRIEEIKVGDQVLSRSEHDLDGPITPKRVEELFVNEREVITLHINGEEIRPTLEHPFYVKNQGWTPAVELKVGDQLATDLKSWKPIEKIVADGVVETVYNFRVAKYHTYFVGSDNWGFAVWTHNCCCEPVEFHANRPFHFFIRDDTTSTILFMGRVMDPGQTESVLTPDVDTIRISEAPPAPIESPDPTEPPLPVTPQFVEPLRDSNGRLIGDIDGDDVVGFDDFLVLSGNYGRNDDVSYADGDLNEDGLVDFADFLLISTNFAKS